ncbi:MAG: hypothetical protein QOF25_4113 [Mycobacterium sp.]|nr:hypothetical protein [Mycobacterium sp.]
MPNVEDSLLELERAGWDSLCNATGSEFYGAIMLPDALMVLANGMVMDRATVVASLSKAPPWRAYDIDDVRSIDIDTDTAVLVYIGTAYRDGQDPAFVGAMTSAYHRTDDGWKLALYTQTRQG